MGIITDALAIMEGLGQESCSIVTRVGSEVSRVKPGDRMIGCRTGAFVTKMVLNEKLCVKIPENAQLTHSEAATMPVVVCTALYAMEDLARLDSKKVSISPSFPQAVANTYAVRLNPICSGRSWHF